MCVLDFLYVWLFVSVEVCVSLFFFFQAEDGIRDKLVTGVQTCALPISGPGRCRRCRASSRRGWWPRRARPGGRRPRVQIGRASCRGKSVDLGGRRIIKKKKNEKRRGGRVAKRRV